MILLLLLLAAIATQIMQNSAGDIINSKISESHFHFVNLSLFVKWNAINNILISLSIFLVSIRLLRLIAFNRWISQFLVAFEKMRPELTCFIPLLSLIICAFAMLYNLLLYQILDSCRSFYSTLITLFSCILGIRVYTYITYMYS